jgi:hypothetical protein
MPHLPSWLEHLILAVAAAVALEYLLKPGGRTTGRWVVSTFTWLSSKLPEKFRSRYRDQMIGDLNEKLRDRGLSLKELIGLGGMVVKARIGDAKSGRFKRLAGLPYPTRGASYDWVLAVGRRCSDPASLDGDIALGVRDTRPSFSTLEA